MNWRNFTTLEQLLAVARRHGIECRRSSGSHHVFSHPAVSGTVPEHRPIKALYVKQSVALIDRIKD